MMRTHVQRTVAVLRRLTSTTTDPSTSTEGHSSDAGSRAGPLDYGNSALAGIPAYLTRRMQSVY